MPPHAIWISLRTLFARTCTPSAKVRRGRSTCRIGCESGHAVALVLGRRTGGMDPDGRRGCRRAGAATGRDFNGPTRLGSRSTMPSHCASSLHECVAGGARDKAGCEHIALAAPAGQSAQLACATAHQSPCSTSSRRGSGSKPRGRAFNWRRESCCRAALASAESVRGHGRSSAATNTIAWAAGNNWCWPTCQSKLAEQVRVLRTEPGASVDPREAYVDAIVLLVPGGPDAIEVWTDDLDVDGVVLDERSGVQSRRLRRRPLRRPKRRRFACRAARCRSMAARFCRA